MRSAIVESGVVVNIVVGQINDSIPCGDEVGVGWLYDGSAFAAPEPEPIEPVVPDVVTMRQAKIALLRSGLLESANAAVASMEGAAGEEARIEWEYATEMRRGHPLVLALGSDLGLSSDDIDALFKAASLV